MVDSDCSSIFDSDEFTYVNKDSTHTTMEFNKNDSFSIHASETESQTFIFSHYEPANLIFNKCYNKKLTYLGLHNNNGHILPPNGKRETYDIYWNINSIDLQILNMLENELILKQSQYFSLFTSLKILTYHLNLITNHYLPKYDNQLGDQFNKILISFKFIYSHFELIYYQISPIILGNMIINEDHIRSIFNTHFRKLDNDSNLYLEGIILFSDLFNEKEFELIKLPKHMKCLASDSTANQYIDSSHSIIPYEIDNFKLFRTVLPFHLTPLTNSACVKHAQNITDKYQLLRLKYENEKIESLLYDTNNSLIKDKLAILIYTPIIIISWIFFSLFVKEKTHRNNKTITIYKSLDD